MTMVSIEQVWLLSKYTTGHSPPLCSSPLIPNVAFDSHKTSKAHVHA